MHDETSRGGAMAPAMIEDLILTDTFLIKGRLPHKNKRLTNLLEDHGRTFLRIEDATMIALRGDDVIRTPSVMVNVKELILAHELLDVAGDEGQRRIAHGARTNRIRAFYNGPVQFELAGRIEPHAYETSHSIVRKYFIVLDPVLKGLDIERENLRVLGSLPYVIVRKDRLAYIYDFG